MVYQTPKSGIREREGEGSTSSFQSPTSQYARYTGFARKGESARTRELTREAFLKFLEITSFKQLFADWIPDVENTLFETAYLAGWEPGDEPRYQFIDEIAPDNSLIGYRVWVCSVGSYPVPLEKSDEFCIKPGTIPVEFYTEHHISMVAKIKVVY